MSTPDTGGSPTPERPQRVVARTTNTFNLSEWLFRAIIVVIFIASASVAWWSLTHVLLPRQKQARDLSTRVARLSAEVDDLELRWNHSDADRIGEKFSRLPGGLFIGDLALGTWVKDLKDQAMPLGLDVQADFGNTAAAETNSMKLVKIPASVTVDVHPGSGVPGQPSPYQRVLQFSQYLTTTEKRADVTELMVSGGTNSIRQVVFGLNLWAGEEAPQ